MYSIWQKDSIDWNFPIISDDHETKLLIIGGGLTGLLCAYQLTKEGIPFILVDARRLAHGVTMKTTAQISVAHDDLYYKIKKKHSFKKAHEYLSQQINGLNYFKSIIEVEKINCDYKEERTILGSGLEKNYKKVNALYDIINPLLDIGKLEYNNSFLGIHKAIEFPNEASINPIKYLNGIISTLKDQQIYEHSKVTKIKKLKKSYEVIINDNFKITADKIIMACHYPFMLQNLYFTKMYQSTSYVMTFKTKKRLSANYVSLDRPYYYLRSYDKNTLMIGGSDHFTGANKDINKCYHLLQKKIYEIDKNAIIKDRWFNEDCMPLNFLPYVGPYSKKHSNIILATGFQKWGFTNAHAAALKINVLLKEDYKPNKLALIKNIKGYLRLVGHSINGLAISRLIMKSDELKNINIESGKAFRYQGKNILAYRANENEYYLFENKCTHMGCTLIWNNVDKVWISKCHGTVYNKHGHVIYGPGIKDLEKIN